MHVFGPPDQYPGAARRSYTPKEAPLSAWRVVARAVGLERVVVVQPSVYGTDNSCTLDALRELGPSARGIAMIEPSTPDSALNELHAAGIRGIRINPKSVGNHDVAGLRTLIVHTAERIAPLGWHLQIYADLALISEVADAIRAASVPVVLDHMGGAKVTDGERMLRPLLTLLSSGHCWVKLTGAYRVSDHERDFSDSTPIAQALVKANPEHVVWGTDWPHTASHAESVHANAPAIEFRHLDDRALLDLMAEAAGDEATFDRILVDNPSRLYGFVPAT
jgi:predicted TIM-barrel fold metal-dependent hydrolase